MDQPQMQTRTLSTPDVDLVLDVYGPLPTADGEPPLLMAGHPMSAEGFTALASYFPDRTVVAYDPRGAGRTVRKDGSTDRSPELHVADLHAIVRELGGRVDLFGSSGGAINGLALVATHPDDVRILVAHEPPLLAGLPDAEAAFAAEQQVQQAYRERGWGAGMAQFMTLTSWQGEIDERYAALPPADPAQFGMPTDDDGGREDPLLGGTANGITAYRLDVDALRAAPTRVVVAVGEESAGTLTDRTARAAAAQLGQEPAVFPSHHGGFLDGRFGYAGQPEAFAGRLREVLDGACEPAPSA